MIAIVHLVAHYLSKNIKDAHHYIHDFYYSLRFSVDTISSTAKFLVKFWLWKYWQSELNQFEKRVDAELSEIQFNNKIYIGDLLDLIKGVSSALLRVFDTVACLCLAFKRKRVNSVLEYTKYSRKSYWYVHRRCVV